MLTNTMRRLFDRISLALSNKSKPVRSANIVFRSTFFYNSNKKLSEK